MGNSSSGALLASIVFNFFSYGINDAPKHPGYKLFLNTFVFDKTNIHIGLELLKGE